MKSKLGVLISIPLVWILDHLPNRRLLEREIVVKMQLARLLNDEDIIRIALHDKPQLLTRICIDSMKRRNFLSCLLASPLALKENR